MEQNIEVWLSKVTYLVMNLEFILNKLLYSKLFWEGENTFKQWIWVVPQVSISSEKSMIVEYSECPCPRNKMETSCP